jgi:hypothetical protein
MVVFPDPDGAENTINFPFFILKSLRGTKQSYPHFILFFATNSRIKLKKIVNSWQNFTTHSKPVP